MQPFDLSGKVAIITGASSGIGLAAATRLAECGADIFVHYRTARPQLKELEARCRELGRRFTTAQADFCVDPDAAVQVVDEAAAALGRVDILVNNAAVTTKTDVFEDVTRAFFEEMLAVNVTALFLATQAAARHMARQGGGGRIINVSSVHSRQSSGRMTAYEASKGAVNALTFSSAISLGRHGITVNAVAPGMIKVERYKDLAHFDEPWSKSRIPLGRVGLADDIAWAIAFLASDEAGYISGETIFVDGAMGRRMGLLK